VRCLIGRQEGGAWKEANTGLLQPHCATTKLPTTTSRKAIRLYNGTNDRTLLKSALLSSIYRDETERHVTKLANTVKASTYTEIHTSYATRFDYCICLNPTTSYKVLACGNLELSRMQSLSRFQISYRLQARLARCFCGSRSLGRTDRKAGVSSPTRGTEGLDLLDRPVLSLARDLADLHCAVPLLLSYSQLPAEGSLPIASSEISASWFLLIDRSSPDHCIPFGQYQAHNSDLDIRSAARRPPFNAIDCSNM